jgi:hypothetical protein
MRPTHSALLASDARRHPFGMEPLPRMCEAKRFGSEVKRFGACRVPDSDRWALGDALLEECGPPGAAGAEARLRAAHKELTATGLSYGLSELRKLRDASAAFPPANRLPEISHAAHIE